MAKVEIRSPLTGSLNIKLEREISATDIIKGYADEFKVDVVRYFEGINKVCIYKCIDTGYRFYYPFHLSGDSQFYERLQEFDWFYMDWKWENEMAAKYIRERDNLLEMGCGDGSFMSRVSKKGVACVGIELNKRAIQKAQSKGLTVFNQTMQDHALQNPGRYDVICSFQTIECIVNIREVLDSMLLSLKKGGKLIFGVPNNDSFIKLRPNYLNMPPQHMGLWNEHSLANLTRIMPLKKIAVYFEPIQKYHQYYFMQTVINYYLKKFNWISPVADRVIPRLVPRMTRLFSARFKGFTLLMIFEKV